MVTDPIIERWAWIPAMEDQPGFFEPGAADRRAEFARARGVSALLWTYEAEALPAVQALHAATGVPICPIVPNMATYARDTRDKGFIGAALGRLLGLPPMDIARICLGAIPSALDVLNKDFATGVCLLAEMELARFRRFHPVAAFLNNQMADLALAFDNARLFERFARLARRRHGLGAGFVTYNFGALAPKLRAWGVTPERIVTPFNPKGYGMYPDRAACEAAAHGFAEAIVACETTAGATLAQAEAEAYLHRTGLRRAIISWDHP